MPEVVRFGVLLLTVLGLNGSALAGCGGGLEAEGKVVGVYVGTGDCEYDEETIVVMDQGGAHLRHYRFVDECRWDRTAVEPRRRGQAPNASYSRGFVCRAESKSPLAGAKYVVAFDWKRKDGCGQSPRVTYACVRGCYGQAPQAFNVLPVDCDG